MEKYNSHPLRHFDVFERHSPAAQRLMTHPSVGASSALAFVLIIMDAKRFQCGKQIACYLGLVPR
jgi:transposase